MNNTTAHPPSSRRTWFPPWLSSVRAAMILLISLATIVPLGVILYQSIRNNTQAYSDARTLSERIVDQVVSDQQLLLSSAEQLMSTLSYLPAVRRREAAAVSALLADLVRKNPQITNLLLADEKGSTWASGLPMKAPFNVSDRRHFRNAMATGRFSSGEFSIGRLLGKPTLLFGFPIRDGSGRITDVATVSFVLDTYERYFRSKELTADASLALLDRKGTFLFTRPTSGLIGQQDKEDLFRKMAAGTDEGSFEGVGRTGVRRVFAYRALRLPGEQEPYMYVRAGISVSSILDRTRKKFLFAMGSIGGAAILILLASVLISKRFILDKVAVLREATERISRGELGLRVPDTISGGELGELGEAIDKMSLGLQEADAKRRVAEEELRQSEKRIRESQHLLQAVMDGTTDAVYVKDLRGRYLFFNATASRITGKSPPEVIGNDDTILFPADEARTVMEGDRRVMVSGKVTTFEEHVSTAGGGNRTYLSTKGPIVDERGNVTGLFGVARDITERMRAEAERNRLSAAIEQAGETVVITDPDGKIQYVNPAFERITGYSHKEAIGQNPRILKSGKQDDAFYRRMWGTISGGFTWEGRMVNKRKDGAFYTEDATISPVLDGTGKIVNYVAVKRDITEHLRLADQFQQSQKMESVGRLAGGVAHDFNNLLTVINGYSELLLQKIGKESPMHGDVEEIKRAGERAALLTQQLLAFSRKQIIEPKVVRLDLLVAEMQGMLTRLIGEDISIQITTGKGLGPVKIDPGQFQQILMNLAVNAKDAMPEGGKIAIETENVELGEGYCASHPYVTPGRYVMLLFGDTGHGMSEEVKGHIFEPFFTTKERGSGTGLGLATTYGAVHQAGGSIEVDSEIGIGTTFRIYLPRVEEEGMKPAKADLPPDLPRGTETVLVVEDEGSVRNVCVEILERRGYKVLQARSGDEALALALGYRERIDLLLTDVVMPGMNGSELATQLVTHYPDMKVLFTSGYTDDAIVRHGVLAEGVSFIGKPYTPSALAKKVRDVLGKG